MRQSIATIVVAWIGFNFLPYAIVAPAGVMAGQTLRMIPYLIVGVLGFVLIVQRRALGQWLVGVPIGS